MGKRESWRCNECPGTVCKIFGPTRMVKRTEIKEGHEVRIIRCNVFSCPANRKKRTESYIDNSLSNEN